MAVAREGDILKSDPLLLLLRWADLDGLSLGHIRNRYVAFSEGVMVLDELLVFYVRITQFYKLQTKIKAVSLYAFYSFRIKQVHAAVIKLPLIT